MELLIIQHTVGNTLGDLEAILDARKLRYAYALGRDLPDGRDPLEAREGLILLGGPESVTEEKKYPHLLHEQHLIREAIARKIPVLGICLGSQILARALGAKISRNRFNSEECKEIGWTPIYLNAAGERDPVLRHLEGQAQFQWHEDTFEIPPGAAHLAESELCPHQAFRLENAEAPAYGVQFHPEVTADVVALWLKQSKTVPEGVKETIRRETERHYPRYHAASRAMFEAFCDLAF